MKYDVFISHASEDKKDVVRPLAAELRKLGLRVWLDEHELKLGDSIRRKIDQGLSESTYGVVILSPAFFSKTWPQKELDGLVVREASGEKIILPVWHKVSADYIAKFSPTLADRFSVPTSLGLRQVAEQVAEQVQKSVAVPNRDAFEHHPEEGSTRDRTLSSQKASMIAAATGHRWLLFAFLIAVAIGLLFSWLKKPTTGTKQETPETESPGPSFLVSPPSK